MKKLFTTAILGCLLSTAAFAAPLAPIACPSLDEINSVSFDLPVQLRGQHYAMVTSNTHKFADSNQEWFLMLGAVDSPDAEAVANALEKIDTPLNAEAKGRRHAFAKVLGCMYKSSENRRLRVLAITPAKANDAVSPADAEELSSI